MAGEVSARRRIGIRFGATAVVAALMLVVAASSTPAAPGVFSFDRLRLGGASGPENYLFTAGDVIVPEGGADTGSYYKFIVTDSAGAVRNGSFPCTPAASFTTAGNSYTIKATDPVSTKTPWKYTLNQYANSTCTGTAAKTASKNLNVPRLSAYADSALTTPRSTFPAGATAYTTIDGLTSATDDWSTTWILPSSSTACANTAGTDRADVTTQGRLPKTAGGFLMYAPASATSNGAWNRDVNYEARPCPAFAAGNQGSWKLRVERDATHFVVLSAFGVDTTPPPTPSIDSGPTGATNSTGAGFAFSSTEAGVSFLCQLDGGGYAGCITPKAYAGLNDGSHQFNVKSRDAAGNESGVASRTWTIDATPPPTPSIGSGPTGATNSTGAGFAFSSTEAGVGFLCQLDGVGYSSCITPASYAGLADGSHTFSVKSRDTAGNESVAASRTWTIDTIAPPAPSIDSGPSGTTSAGSASFGFSSTEAGVSHHCRLDGGGYTACTSPTIYSGLIDGSHSFVVKSQDGAGNESAAASRGWTVDTVAPGVTLASPPDGSTTSSATPTFSGAAGTAAGDSATVNVKVFEGPTATGIPIEVLTATRDGGTYSVDASPPLAGGTYTARAEQSDTADNTGQSTAHTFTVAAAPAPPANTSVPTIAGVAA